MKVGTVCKLKVDCLCNKAGTLGVVFYSYGDGFQAIFENGNYDGFSTTSTLRGFGMSGYGKVIEADHFLEEVGFEKTLAGYHFQSVMRVSADYRKGVFKIVWSENSKNFAKGMAMASVGAGPPTLLDCCELYIRKVEGTYSEMGKKPTSTIYYMMKEAISKNSKPETQQQGRLNDQQICGSLRILSKQINPGSTVLLPALKPSEMMDDSKTDRANFELVRLAKLLYFIADMI